jgi:hypothetical protein
MENDLPVTVVKPLRECGKDEYWLQEKIYENPSILGLGDLERVRKEQIQSSNGRLDMLLKHPEDGSMFEVEVMLGDTDESHIIRTIEYWDRERRRWGKRNHTAVLVAEGINTRFINVVYLLSEAIPIIGIQVSALELEGRLALHFTKMIDSYEEPEDEEDSPLTDRNYWKTHHPNALTLAEALEGLAKALFEDVKLRFEDTITIMIGGWRRIWIWQEKQEKGASIWAQFRIEGKEAEALKQALEAKGIYPKISGTRYTYLKFETEKDSLAKHPEEYKKLLLGLYAEDLKRKVSTPAPLLTQAPKSN